MLAFDEASYAGKGIDLADALDLLTDIKNIT